jgi:hypothetical protein
MGVLPNHPLFIDGFPSINHPCLRIPPLMEPTIFLWFSHDFSMVLLVKSGFSYGELCYILNIHIYTYIDILGKSPAIMGNILTTINGSNTWPLSYTDVNIDP